MRKFLEQFSDVLVILLIVAALISGVLWFIEPGDAALPYEAIAILAIVLLNAGMGYFQQARAERALAALNRMSAARANVVREGERQSVVSSELVPGDIILVEEGDTIPADARLVQSTSLQTAEAALTGESLPVSKDTVAVSGETGLGDRRNMVFSGTVATYGHGRAVVTATGMNTEMGRIAGLLERTPDETTPLQRELDRGGHGCSASSSRHRGRVMIEPSSCSRTSTALRASSTCSSWASRSPSPRFRRGCLRGDAVLALGVQRMARRNAIIRHLAAVETLGSADVIASDKTGTLTRNEMTVRRIVTASGSVDLGGTGYAPDGKVERHGGGPLDGALRTEFTRTVAAADRANNAVLQERDGRWSVQGDPTEGALIVAALKAGLEEETLDARFERVGEVPFSSERKLMSTVHADAEQQGRLRAFTKGAPDMVLSRCSHELVGGEARPLTDERRASIRSANDELAGKALRTLAIAFRSLPADAPPAGGFGDDVEHDLVFLGLIGIIDPPREEAKAAVARAKAAGIRPVMITGDHPRTAAVIAAELGIVEGGGRVLTGAELEKMPEAELDRAVREVSVYGRVDPHHKLRIVEAMQRNGMTVAMTGDGINDAPAMKSADIGVAMGITARTSPRKPPTWCGPTTISLRSSRPWREGRAIFSNIRKFLRYMLSSNIGEVMTMFFGVFAWRRHRPRRGGRGRPRLAAARHADPVDQSGHRRDARARARRRPAGPRNHGEAAAPAGRRRDHAADVGGHPVRRRHHGRRDAAGARRLLARRADRRLGRPGLWADNGLHDADALPALQHLKRAIGPAKCFCRFVRQSLAVAGDRILARAACGRDLPAVPADGLLDGPARARRLDDLRGRCEFGPVAARSEQAHHQMAGRQDGRNGNRRRLTAGTPAMQGAQCGRSPAI